MDIMIIKEYDGSHRQVPMLRFKIHPFDAETYLIVGGDTEGCLPEARHFHDGIQQPGFLTERLGRLSDLPGTLMVEITERILVSQWPVEDHPDPDVIMVTAPRPKFHNN